MSLTERRTFECVQCGRRETAADALVITCPRCGGEMRNVEPVGD
ncbi:rubrerythrin-like domain-containing protein [Natrialbaceae archaeon GCM10025810]